MKMYFENVLTFYLSFNLVLISSQTILNHFPLVKWVADFCVTKFDNRLAIHIQCAVYNIVLINISVLNKSIFVAPASNKIHIMVSLLIM